MVDHVSKMKDKEIKDIGSTIVFTDCDVGQFGLNEDPANALERIALGSRPPIRRLGGRGGKGDDQVISLAMMMLLLCIQHTYLTCILGYLVLR